MMAQRASFIALVAALFINTLFYCSAENVYCVTPAATSCSSCPHNSTHCMTLSEYAQEAELYFTSDTTMVFLPGDHTLDMNITVANVTSLTMRGDSSSGNITTVLCNSLVGFSFTNMADFNVYFLAFTTYNRPWSYSSLLASNSILFFLQSTQHAKLVNCSFHDNIGTALAVSNTSITLTGNNEFVHNQCACESFSYNCKLGCGITALNSTLTFTGNTTFLENNASYYGSIGAIWASASSLDFNGTNNFINNSADYDGGAIYAVTNSSLSFNGTNTFSYNSANRGSAIYAERYSSLRFLGVSTFSRNTAGYDGGAIHVERYSSLRFLGTSTFSNVNAVLTFDGTNNFLGNSAGYRGGAISCAGIYLSLSFLGTSTFSNNTARYGSGGAIYAGIYSSLSFLGTSTFSNNTARYGSGGAIYAGIYSSLSFLGTSNFSNNTAGYKGGGINAYDSTVLINGTNSFINNSAKVDGGAINAYETVVFNFTGTSSFSSNSAKQGGAISANGNSKLTFDGNISFTNNTANSHGGALYLYTSSTFSVLLHTTVCWENNHANLGGAIFVYDVNSQIYCDRFLSKEECFFQLPGHDLSHGIKSIEMQLFFKNNSADTAGSVLYGGAIDNCTLIGLESNNSGEVFDMLFQYEHDNTTSSISSEPFHICPCENNSPNCSQSMKILSVYPGETYQVSLATVGQRDGIVPANITSMNRDKLPCSQIVQPTTRTCTTLSYAVDPKQKVFLKLYIDSTCPELILQLNGTQSCQGSANNSMLCICDQAHTKGIDHCNFTNESVEITRESEDTFWVGYNLSAYKPSLVVHPYCPFDYCVSDRVTFTLNNTDLQCAHNRTGILCGSCKQGYILELGTFHCTECTNNYLALLIPFALMGVALVFLLLVCKLTVATGTLSGLVFYANIVGEIRTIFLPVKSTDALSVFVAWLNLDFGIETCFYDGMDAYSKTWLQFVFPVYLWVLVGLMIFISHLSPKFADMLGSNPVSALATLILLSYANILRTLITVVSFTYLEYPNIVWLYDANIEYFSKERIPLLLVVLLVFFFLFLPYTLLLLFGQWLQAISHLRLFSWVNRLKPFIDSYHAPYKAKHRYWPGLLLVLRFVLLLVFALNPQQDTSINLLAVLLGAGILQLWAWVSGGVYKNWCLDALEGSFVLNLIILVGATYHVKLTYVKDHAKLVENVLAVGYTSVSIAFVTFIGILAYHIFQQLRHTKLWKKVPKLNMKLRFKKLNTKLNKKMSTKQEEENINNLTNDTTESGKFDQLREPLLDDLPQPTHSVV